MDKEDRRELARHFAGVLNIQENERVTVSYPRLGSSDLPKPRKLAQALAKEFKVGHNYVFVMGNTAYPDYISIYISKSSRISANDNHPKRSYPFLLLPPLNQKFAEAAGVTIQEASQAYKKILMVDYRKMADLATPLHQLMAATHNVSISGPGTDLSFSIKDIGACTGRGDINCPEGEVFSAPVKETVNGTVKFGPSTYGSKKFSHISLEFKDGKVIKAAAKGRTETDSLNTILDCDDGARYVGEFAIAFNPYLKNPTGSILLDEKITGSFHMALGRSLSEADNGNRSNIHWDLVQIQRSDKGGGEIWMDQHLIRKNGIFTSPELEILNPDKLKTALSSANDNNKNIRPERKPGPGFEFGG